MRHMPAIQAASPVAPTADADPVRMMHAHRGRSLIRTVVIGLTAFLTVVDLFATQAILPSLTNAYAVTPAAMSLAVNASTLGMAVAGLLVAFLGRSIERRWGIVASLIVLALPTALLASAPDLATFAVLRVAQGLCMASAFALTLAYLGEECSAADAGGAFAAYITGNVASNLIGRLMSAAVADHLGLASNFYFFAMLNLAGAALVFFTVGRAPPTDMPDEVPAKERSPLGRWAQCLQRAELRAAFGIGFCILFAFIGTFTFVNFVLVRPPLFLSPMSLGFVYFVFLPSIFTTLCAGSVVARVGVRPTIWASFAIAGVGLMLMLGTYIPALLFGMVLVGVGTFFAQAATTGFVGRAAGGDHVIASGTYLACYFFGGMAGTAVLGIVFDQFGWTACVAGVAAALALAALLATRLKTL